MTELPNDVVGDAYRSTTGWDLIADLEDLDDRMPGHEGEREGAELVAEASRQSASTT
nr:hypothetical protein [Halogeometricum sp. CBA1124]